MSHTSIIKRIFYHTFTFKVLCYVLSISYFENAIAAASQLLNDLFFQNPAELTLVNKFQIIAGGTYLKPQIQFDGTSNGNTGSVKSKANDTLPYLLTAFRFNKSFVFGINVTPSSYGHLIWPMNSIVSLSSTLTKVVYYRFAAQSGYQLTSHLAVGAGINLEYNKLIELNYVVNGMGNQINKASGKNPTADLGLFYKISSKNYLTAAVYTPVNALGRGTSTLGTTVSNNLAMSISQAPVAFIGLQHLINEKASLEGKVYWSGWSLQKTLIMSNTTTGTTLTPTNWKDVWSFQTSTRYTTTERIALLGFANYETNPIDAAYNQVGYPLAAFGSIGAGIDYNLKNGGSTQCAFGYGKFMPDAKLNNLTTRGATALHIPLINLQLSYKV